MTFLIIALAVLVVVARRRGRRSTLAGLNADKPTFTLAPPTRWSTTGKDHRL